MVVFLEASFLKMLKDDKDFDLLIKATEPVRHISDIEDLKTWFACPDHVMLSEGDSVGLGTLEYPGLYNVHWFYTVRGRKALNLARDMIKYLFEHKDAQAVRGMIRTDLKPSIWAARQVGLKSHGVLETPTGSYELFCMTKNDFYKDEING